MGPLWGSIGPYRPSNAARVQWRKSRSTGCSPISRAGPSSSRWASTNHTPLKSMWASRKDLCLALCLQSTAALSPTSSLTVAYSITNTSTTRSSISPCAPTTHPPSVPLMSDSGTCPAERSTAQPRQVRSSDRRNHQSAACGDVIRVRGRSRPASSRWYQSAGGRARSASVVSQACLGGDAIVSYHTQAIQHIRHQLTKELAQTPACSLILSKIDYCNAVLHVAPSYSIKKLQQVQNDTAQIVLEAPRRSHASPLVRTLHWLPVQQRIDYKVALLTFKVCITSTPSCLHCLIQDRSHCHNLWSTTTTLCQPFTTTSFMKRAFQCATPAVWNSLPKTVLSSDSVAVCKYRLKTFLFFQAFSSYSAY